jgi:hypothetical protein
MMLVVLFLNVEKMFDLLSCQYFLSMECLKHEKDELKSPIYSRIPSDGIHLLEMNVIVFWFMVMFS